MTTESRTQNPIVVRAADAERVADGPTSEIVLLADAEHTAGKLSINRAVLAPGSPGAPVHSHQATTEAIFVLAGSLDVLSGEELTTLTAGDLIVLTPGTVHAFAPTAGESADMLAIYSPGQDRFDYYRLLERLYRGSATVEDLVRVAPNYDNHYAESEIWQAREI